MLKLITIISIFIFLLSPDPAQADWIMLTNGDRISGQITNQQGSHITLNHDIMGSMTIEKSKIASTHIGTAPRITARELRTGRPISSPNTPETIIATHTPSAPITPTQPTTKKEDNNKPQRQAGIYDWSGRISLGGTMEDGSNRSKSITADTDIKARDLKNRFTFGAEANWAEEDGEKTDNDQQVYATYDRFLTEKWFIGGKQELEQDEFEELDLRSQTGVFAGYQFYEQDDLNLQIKAGPEYIYEKFENGDSESDLALGWNLDYNQKLFKEKSLQAFHNHELSTPFADTNAFLFESESGIRVPIAKRLDASLQVDFDWDNDPAPGIRENDTTYALKLGYGWE